MKSVIILLKAESSRNFYFQTKSFKLKYFVETQSLDAIILDALMELSSMMIKLQHCQCQEKLVSTLDGKRI